MRLLIIEDDIEQLDALARTLRSANYAVDTADSGQAGYALLSGNEYDLAILDYCLPDTNGLALCQRLRADKRPLPLLMLSIRSAPTDKAELLNNGADDYLAKPFFEAELLARVSALLRRPTRESGRLLTVSGLEIDLARRVALRLGQELPLTRYEFGLLEYLVRLEGRTASRVMILDHVWEEGADIFSNTIETHIHNLRRKLAAAGCQRLIRTVPGLGYVIDRAKA